MKNLNVGKVFEFSLKDLFYDEEKLIKRSY
jgi:hypothetical protein